MADINIGKFINNIDDEDLTSEKLQGVVNNVYAKAISTHKKKQKEVEENTKEQDEETVKFVKSNHDRLKAHKKPIEKDIDKDDATAKDKVAKEINESFANLSNKEKIDYVINNYKKITGRNISGVYAKGMGEDENAPVFDQDHIDATADRIEKFLKKNGMSSKEIDDFYYDLDAELASRYNELSARKPKGKVNEAVAEYVETDRETGATIYKDADTGRLYANYLTRTVSGSTVDEVKDKLSKLQNDHISHFRNLPESKKINEETILPGNIYDVLVKEIPAEDIDHYNSDLYVRKTPQSTEIINKLSTKSLLSTFKDNIDGDIWYELPFCYTPHLEKKESKKVNEAASPKELYWNKEEALKDIWGLVCEGDDRLEDIRYIFESGLLKPNEFRYNKFGAKHSLIMGALRNGNYKTVELLKSLGEKILKSEVEEYKDIMTKRVYSDETVRSALDESRLAYYEYRGCKVRETPSTFVAINEHGLNIGESPTAAGAERIIDDYLEKQGVKTVIGGQPRRDGSFAEKHPNIKLKEVSWKVTYDKGRPDGTEEIIQAKSYEDAKQLAAEHANGWGFEVKRINESKKLKEAFNSSDIADWLEEHEQAAEDCKTFFKVDDLSKVRKDRLISWISDHDTLTQDFETKFKVKLDGEVSLGEDTIKQGSQWVNKGKEGTHGKFKTKKEADAQRKAMFAQGYKGESLKEELSDEDIFDILGIEQENRTNSKHLLSQFRRLQKKYGTDSIWLKGDVGSAVKGKVIGRSNDLAVVESKSVKRVKKLEESAKSWVLFFDKDGQHRAGSDWSTPMSVKAPLAKQRALNHKIVWPNDAEGFIVLTPDHFSGINYDELQKLYNAGGISTGKLDRSIPFTESKKLTEEVHDGDNFEFFGLSFSLWYLDDIDKSKPEEYAICCDDILNEYDNTPVYVGTVTKNATEKEIKEICWDWISDQPKETFKDFEVVNELPDGNWFFANKETIDSLKKQYGKNMEWLPHENMYQLYRPEKHKKSVNNDELPWDPWEKELDYAERNYGPDESLNEGKKEEQQEKFNELKGFVYESILDINEKYKLELLSKDDVVEDLQVLFTKMLSARRTNDITQPQFNKLKKLLLSLSFVKINVESGSVKLKESLKEGLDANKVQKLVDLFNRKLITKNEFKTQLDKLLGTENLVVEPRFENTKIKDFYTDNYPTDDLGEEIADTVTVPDVVSLLNDGRGDDFYSLIGVSDSLVRERIFAFIADVCGVKYDVVYNKWLEESFDTKSLKEARYNDGVSRGQHIATVDLFSTGVSEDELKKKEQFGGHYEIDLDNKVFTKVKENRVLGHWFIETYPRDTWREVEQTAKYLMKDGDFKEVSNDEYLKIQDEWERNRNKK